MLVLHDIKCLIVIPAKLNGQIKTVEAVFNGTFVCTSTHGSITEWREFMMIRRKYFPGFSSGPFEYDNHESPHQESCICLFSIVEAGVVIDFVLNVLLITYQLLKFFAEKMDFTQI